MKVYLHDYGAAGEQTASAGEALTTLMQFIGELFCLTRKFEEAEMVLVIATTETTFQRLRSAEMWELPVVVYCAHSRIPVWSGDNVADTATQYVHHVRNYHEHYPISICRLIASVAIETGRQRMTRSMSGARRPSGWTPCASKTCLCGLISGRKCKPQRPSKP